MFEIKKNCFLLASLCMPLLAQAQPDSRTLVHCGHLVDSIRGKLLQKQTVVIAGGKIVRLEEGYALSRANDTVVNLKEHTVMPGLMDITRT